MKETGYYIAVGLDRSQQLARGDLQSEVGRLQRLGYEVSGDLTVFEDRHLFYTIYYFYQPMIKREGRTWDTAIRQF